jgi:acyl transferase domain-containing protein
MIECHGTSTRVGDVVELNAIGTAFAGADLAPGSVSIGSAKSNIGHLKAAAGAAGLVKAALSIHHGELAPSLGFNNPNPNVDWSSTPFRVNTDHRPWEVPAGKVRTAGVSAFGFGGTNFHAVLEQYVPGRLHGNGRMVAAGAGLREPVLAAGGGGAAAAPAPAKAPLRGAAVLGAADEASLRQRVAELKAEAEAGRVPPLAAPLAADLRAPERVAIDFADAADLADKAGKALAAFDKPPDVEGDAGTRDLPGPRAGTQGGIPLHRAGLAVRQHARRAPGQRAAGGEHVRRGRRGDGAAARAAADLVPLRGPGRCRRGVGSRGELRRTEITQPAVLSVDLALTRLLAAYGVEPDMVMGHSLGEYGALVAAGCLTLPAALEAVSARGREMAHLTVEDNGAMAAVFAPLTEVEQIVADADGYVVLANVNSTSQAVIGGATAAVERAVAACQARGFTTAMLPVSHAFHTSIVAPPASRCDAPSSASTSGRPRGRSSAT